MIRRPGRLDRVLVALFALALATLWAPAAVPDALGASAVALALAALKARCIVLHYLDLRAAPPLWRGLAGTWIVAVVSIAWLAAAAALLI